MSHKSPNQVPSLFITMENRPRCQWPMGPRLAVPGLIKNNSLDCLVTHFAPASASESQIFRRSLDLKSLASFPDVLLIRPHLPLRFYSLPVRSRSSFWLGCTSLGGGASGNLGGGVLWVSLGAS